MGADTQMIAELVELLAVDGPVRTSSLSAAIERGDLAEADRVAHTLKGSVSHFEARRAFDLAKQVETAARASWLTSPPAACWLSRDLTIEITRLVAELREWARTLPAAESPAHHGHDTLSTPKG